MEEVRQRLGPIAVLINNAANDQRQDADEVGEADWDRAMAVNLKHQFFAAQIARRSMRELGGGSIVDFSSTAWMFGVAGSRSIHRQGRRHRPDQEPRARIRSREHPRQRHRSRRRHHRTTARLWMDEGDIASYRARQMPSTAARSPKTSRGSRCSWPPTTAR